MLESAVARLRNRVDDRSLRVESNHLGQAYGARLSAKNRSGSGGANCTRDLLGMSQASYSCSTPR